MEPRLFSVAEGTQILGFCHWQPNRNAHPTVVLLHGLEGCSESHYIHGLAAKSWKAGFNVIRLNQRNCGGTEHLTETLYHSGLSDDYKAVVSELASVDGLDRVWMIGYSMGGNLLLKMAGEAGHRLPALRGVLTVCPNIEPGACVQALERPKNWIYQRYFLKRLKARLQRKAALFPHKFDLSHLFFIHTLREFDNRYTAPDGGFRDAGDYYDQAGARHVVAKIEVPTLIITSQDDPFIPYDIFLTQEVQQNPWMTLVAPTHGGHCGFFQRPHPREDYYWAENRLVEYMLTPRDTIS